MTNADEVIIARFAVGYYDLHPNPSLNYQMNRFWNWVGEQSMLDELRAAGSRIHDYNDWTREMVALSNAAQADGRGLAAAYYSKAATFFLDPKDPQFAAGLKRFMDNVLSHAGIAPGSECRVPYQNTTLTAYRLTPANPCGTIVVFGGYDSYIVEWLPAAMAFRDAGLDTIIFDGPGQGTVLDAGTTMTPDWHLPTAAVLDYFGLKDVTLLGFSLGGALVLRAAAYESRVKRAVAFDICTDLFEAATQGFGPAGLAVIAANAADIPAAVVNAAVGAVDKADMLTQFVFAQGKRVMGVDAPAEIFAAWHKYRTEDISSLVKQDILLMAGSADHYMPLHMLADQLMSLTSARSVTARVFTKDESAQNHCQIGNMGLALRVILGWLDETNGRAVPPPPIYTANRASALLPENA